MLGNESEANLNADLEEAAMDEALQEVESRARGEAFAFDSNGSIGAISGEVLAIALQALLAEEVYVDRKLERIDTAAFTATPTGSAIELMTSCFKDF